MRAVEHRFTGPAYTIGIEEELMIVDAETLELSNSIESLLEALGETNAVKPELMESVCEIATEPCRDTVEAGRAASRPAQARPDDGRGPRPRDRLGRHAPVRACGRTSGSSRARATAT